MTLDVGPQLQPNSVAGVPGAGHRIIAITSAPTAAAPSRRDRRPAPLPSTEYAARVSAEGGSDAPFKRKKNADEPVDLEARSPQTGLKYRDIQLLGQMMSQGADLNQPRHTLYYLYFDTREAAAAGAVEVFQGLADRLGGECDGWEAAV
jgi:hypothetical protein